MKFKISSKILLTHLSNVSKVVNPKNTIQILNNFLFELKNKELIVTGTDTENTIVARMELDECDGDCAFAVPAKRMLDLLKELPDQSLDFDVDLTNFEIHIIYSNGDYKFMGVDGSEFPRLENESEEQLTMTIPAVELTKSIERTVFAVSQDSLRLIMTGILLDVKPDKIIFVASDTHKLVRYINQRVTPDIEGSFILPSKPDGILSSVLAKEENDVKVIFDTKSASFETANYTFVCQFINGKYPNYEMAIPKVNPYSMIVDRVQLLNAVRRVAVFATEGGLVQLDIADGHIHIKTQDLEYASSAEESLTCEYSDERIVHGFNKDRMIEVLSNIEGDNLEIRFSAPGRPGLFLPVEQPEGEDCIALLMPMVVPNA